MRPRRDVAAELQRLAADRVPLPASPMEEGGELSEGEIEVRLGWFRRQGQTGHKYALAGALGPSTVVWVRSEQILVREYVGVNVHEV
jgi:hypothetical protein